MGTWISQLKLFSMIGKKNFTFMYQWHLKPGGVNLKTIFNFLETLPCKMISTAKPFLAKEFRWNT